MNPKIEHKFKRGNSFSRGDAGVGLDDEKQNAWLDGRRAITTFNPDRGCVTGYAAAIISNEADKRLKLKNKIKAMPVEERRRIAIASPTKLAAQKQEK